MKVTGRNAWFSKMRAGSVDILIEIREAISSFQFQIQTRKVTRLNSHRCFRYCIPAFEIEYPFAVLLFWESG